ncbi:small nuclear ribonucleoprotein LSM1 isoform X1 [Zea mays]|uniref:small nuclear ribonucleoprotein LSM1 isoform X1 n=1 Tax=Zea mays TaxID=4577 RepID=UPI0004DE944F|nr:small nuclear ribonucleoprotein LSM1 isoform X1 [Zea mays]|eukprot:XP_008667883.1 small nuclear ribonucleoprotein LSM1 isoform X1 [Zea mays]
MSWSAPDDILLSTSLAGFLDKKLIVLLRDGRKLLGTLCSFDQFANVVLQGACERVIVGEQYCDVPLGLYVIRGENVVLIGELDHEKDELPAHMTCVLEAEIRKIVHEQPCVFPKIILTVALKSLLSCSFTGCFTG